MFCVPYFEMLPYLKVNSCVPFGYFKLAADSDPYSAMHYDPLQIHLEIQ